MLLYLAVDGGWGAWGPWSGSGCPTDCLQGRKTKTRTRTCTNPAPQGIGNGCNGENTEQHICGGSMLVCFFVAGLLLTLHNVGVNR